jgi:glutathione S-transferase
MNDLDKQRLDYLLHIWEQNRAFPDDQLYRMRTHVQQWMQQQQSQHQPLQNQSMPIPQPREIKRARIEYAQTDVATSEQDYEAAVLQEMQRLLDHVSA